MPNQVRIYEVKQCSLLVILGTFFFCLLHTIGRELKCEQVIWINKLSFQKFLNRILKRVPLSFSNEKYGIVQEMVYAFFHSECAENLREGHCVNEPHSIQLSHDCLSHENLLRANNYLAFVLLLSYMIKDEKGSWRKLQKVNKKTQNVGESGHCWRKTDTEDLLFSW